jgi:hypothetical protein
VGNSSIEQAGGAACASGSSSPTLVNCLFLHNSTQGQGGGFSAGRPPLPGSPKLINCTFFGNSAGTGGGYSQTGPGTGTLRNCILWGDSPDEIVVLEGAVDVTYSDIQGGWPGTGNIDADPLFVDPDGPDNIPGNEDDDLRLAAGSPCIDSGDNTALPADEPDLDTDGDTTEPIPVDLDGNPRITGDAVDMGAYEYLCPADTDGNGAVDVDDLTAVILDWGTDGSQFNGDVDGSGMVDVDDLTAVILGWGPCE